MMSPTESLVEYSLGSVEQIPLGEGRAFQVAGHDVAVFRLRGGGIATTQAQCPHRAGPLADGIVGLDSIVCPLHAWRLSFATGAAEVGDCGIVVYPSRLDDDGEILVALTAASEG